MITIELNGGLGNQMFQYAFGYSLIKKNYNVQFDPYVFFREKINLSLNRTVSKRYLELSIFPNIQLIKQNIFISIYSRILKRVLRIQSEKNITLTDYSKYDIDILSTKILNNDVRYKGFFQNEKYFIENRKDLLEIFSFPDFNDINDIRLAERIIEKPNAVCIHIRRGDYLTCGAHVLKMDYYQKAMEMICNEISNPYFFLFGQDCEDFLHSEFNLNYEYEIIKKNKNRKDFRDMQLMSLCKHFIIANSSFSWWAAWLSKNHGIVIAPSPWLQNKDEIICDNWRKIKCQ